MIFGRKFLPGLTAAATLFAAALSFAHAQAVFPTDNPSVTVPGMLNMCLGPDAKARPCNDFTSLGFRLLNPAYVAPYPVSAVPYTVNSSGTTASFTATVVARAGAIAYLCGFIDDAVATAATAVTGTISGLTGGTFTYIQQVGTLTGTGNYHYSQSFAPCIPAALVNSQIQMTTGAPGAGGVQGVLLWGFYLPQ